MNSYITCKYDSRRENIFSHHHNPTIYKYLANRVTRLQKEPYNQHICARSICRKGRHLTGSAYRATTYFTNTIERYSVVSNS